MSFQYWLIVAVWGGYANPHELPTARGAALRHLFSVGSAPIRFCKSRLRIHEFHLRHGLVFSSVFVFGTAENWKSRVLRSLCGCLRARRNRKTWAVMYIPSLGNIFDGACLGSAATPLLSAFAVFGGFAGCEIWDLDEVSLANLVLTLSLPWTAGNIVT